jgi:hypothetical protein
MDRSDRRTRNIRFGTIGAPEVPASGSSRNRRRVVASAKQEPRESDENGPAFQPTPAGVAQGSSGTLEAATEASSSSEGAHRSPPIVLRLDSSCTTRSTVGVERARELPLLAQRSRDEKSCSSARFVKITNDPGASGPPLSSGRKLEHCVRGIRSVADVPSGVEGGRSYDSRERSVNGSPEASIGGQILSGDNHMGRWTTGSAAASCLLRHDPCACSKRGSIRKEVRRMWWSASSSGNDVQRTTPRGSTQRQSSPRKPMPRPLSASCGISSPPGRPAVLNAFKACGVDSGPLWTSARRRRRSSLAPDGQRRRLLPRSTFLICRGQVGARQV